MIFSRIKSNLRLQSLRDARGAMLIDFAFSILIVLAVMFGVMDFCRAMYSYHFISYAAQEGARFAMVRGGDWTNSCNTVAPPAFTMKYSCAASTDGADVQNYVRSIALPGIVTSDLTTSTSYPGLRPGCASSCSCPKGNNAAPCMVKVTVTYYFHFFMPFLPKSAAIKFGATSAKVIQY